MKSRRLWITIALCSIASVVRGQPLPATDEIVQVLEARQRANVAPQIACAMNSLPYPPDQDGYQEIQPRVAPNTYIARFALHPGKNRRPEDHRQNIERLDFLASVGLLSAKDVVLTRGFFDTAIAAREYQLTPAGWLAGLGGCLYLGRVELLRAIDYTESAPAPNGYRTLKVRTLMGVRYPPDWARSDTSRRLFPVIQQMHDGVQREETLYRDPQGRIDTANTYIGSLQHLSSEEQTRAREWRMARLTVDAANGILGSIPLKSARIEGHALPDACFELFPAHHERGRSLFTRSDDGSYSPQLPKEMTGSGAEYAMLYARMRAMRLVDAGLATFEKPPETDASQLKLRLTAHIEELVAKHGPCLPAGESRIELVGVGYASEQGSLYRPRIYARSQVIAPAAWTRSSAAMIWLPELAALLQTGIFFEVDVAPRPGQWRVERVRSHAPTWALPRLDAIGISPNWRAGFLRQKGVSAIAPSVKTHELHVLSAYEGTNSADAASGKLEIEVSVRPMTRPALVVLTGYRRTQWRFHVAPGARIGAVLALGHEAQLVTGLPEHVPVVSAAHLVVADATYTAIGRIPRLEIAAVVPRSGSAVVTLGPDGPTSSSAQIVQRGTNEHIVVPQGVRIIQKGPGEFQISEFESTSSARPVSGESLVRIREMFGVPAATVQFAYTGSRFIVDGLEGRTDSGGGK